MFHSIAAMVVFVKDMAKCKTFYRDTLGLKVTESDPEHVAVHMDNVYFLLLEIGAAAHMVSEREFGLNSEGGPRGLLATGVEDVDAAYEELTNKGVRFLRPPTDQPWGLRTAYFADPEGNLWEINQPIAEKPKG
jgi:catechol 2,3-dioxygenase-like lactoylglutathione lyase family enzyme